MRTGFKLGTFLSLCITALMASCGSDEPAASGCNNNNVAEEGEACDGADTRGTTCATATMNASSTGVVSCQACVLNTQGCTGGGQGGQGGQGGMGPTP